MDKIKRGYLAYFLLGVVIILLAIFFIAPVFKKTAPPRPGPKIYSYYKIIDIANGKTLMYVSSMPVTKGDELITSENRKYVVVKMKGNLAYAKYVKKVKLKKRSSKPDTI